MNVVFLYTAMQVNICACVAGWTALKSELFLDKDASPRLGRAFLLPWRPRRPNVVLQYSLWQNTARAQRCNASADLECAAAEADAANGIQQQRGEQQVQQCLQAIVEACTCHRQSSPFPGSDFL